MRFMQPVDADDHNQHDSGHLTTQPNQQKGYVHKTSGFNVPFQVVVTFRMQSLSVS